MPGCKEQSRLELGGGIIPIPRKEAELTTEHQHVRKQPGRPELLGLRDGVRVGFLRLSEAVGVGQRHAEKEVWVPEPGLVLGRIKREADSTAGRSKRFRIPTLSFHGNG
jgi:hypothetical protein